MICLIFCETVWQTNSLCGRKTNSCRSPTAVAKREISKNAAPQLPALEKHQLDSLNSIFISYLSLFVFLHFTLLYNRARQRALEKKQPASIFICTQLLNWLLFTFPFLIFTFLYGSAMHRAPEKHQFASLVTSRAQLLQLTSLAFLFLLATDSAVLTIYAMLSFILSLRILSL